MDTQKSLELTFDCPPFTGSERMRYETPSGGITLTGYLARRLQKTALLRGIEADICQHPALALIKFGFYAAASATSWGPVSYQPRFERPGASYIEEDPDTGAEVSVSYVQSRPHYTFTFEVRLPDGGLIKGTESITGTTLGLKGVGMPAPSRLDYWSADRGYAASATGIITSELVLKPLRATLVRGYGELRLTDLRGSSGNVTLDREAVLRAVVWDRLENRYRAAYRLR
jgi:hypothetical protein